MAEERANDLVKVEEDAIRTTSADELIANSELTADDIAATEELAKASKKHGGIVTLAEYQQLIVETAARFLAFMVCRQGGKTFASTLRIVRKVLTTVLNYYILSRSERQSANAIAQAAAHARALEKMAKARGKQLAAKAYTAQKLRVHRRDGSALEYNRLTIGMPNGARIIGLPASPDTVVGISGAVYCDEFALHRDSREIYARIFPVVSRRKEYELLITSTPRGVGNKFHDIMTGESFAEVFTRLIVDIYAAVEQGLVLFDYKGEQIRDAAGVERLKAALKDDDRWNEEYLVQFVNDTMALLTHEMISQCEALHDPDGKIYEPLNVDLQPNFDPAKEDLAKLLNLKGGDLFVGHDVARQRDLSVIWVDELIDGRLWQRGLVKMRKIDYELQEAVLWQFLAHPRLRKAGIDATGLGGRTAERAVTKFGSRIVPLNFSSSIKDRHGRPTPVKSMIARVMRERHQDGRDRYPIRDEIRDDFLRVKRKQGGTPDTFTYFADHDETGHADIFTAKALSAVVAQELIEFGGRVEAMRLAPPAEVSLDNERERMRLEDAGLTGGGDFAGVGKAGW